ncbi:hypothetical protein M8J77_016434 [Diaphorina citri]|nr:hypothetical protein M8J77_016434 [Diaphorina citri]
MKHQEPHGRKMVDITRDKPIKVTIRVIVPVRDHPKFNFVGKLLGPKGNSLKRLQEDTMTRMAILGRGSIRDRHKEEELRISGDPKFLHLLEELHVEITAFAPPAEAHARIAYALAEVRRFLVPDYNDEIRQEQMWEMQILKEDGGAASCSESSESSVNNPLLYAENTSPVENLTPPEYTLVDPAFNRIQPATEAINIPTKTMTTAALVNRKRPLLTAGSSRPTMSPTKRTVLSILTRARVSQSKPTGVLATSKHHYITNGEPGIVNGIVTTLDPNIINGANLVLNTM